MSKIFCRVRFLFLIIFLLSFVCKSEIFANSFSWHNSFDKKVWIWTDDDRDFVWKGSDIEGYADGPGIIQFVGKGFSFEGSKLVYGVKSSDFVELNGSGDKYAGEGKGQGEKIIPDGRGVLIKANGNTYVGSFKNGKTDGKAIRFYEGKIVYKGDFKANVFHGVGELYKDKENLFDGNGKVFERQKISYSGGFKNGKRDGTGTEYGDGFSISGKYKQDLKDGHFVIKGHGITREVFYKDDIPDLKNAKISYKGGVVWEGGIDSILNPKGEGKVSYANGDLYEGEVQDNKREGFGTFSSGDFSYEGDWENDKCSGFGEATFAKGWFYSGNWLDNVFEGHGVLNAGDFRYSGNWSKGKKNGFGTLLLGSSKFVGQFKNDRINGEGEMFYANGDYYEGDWKDSRHEGYGEYTWVDGSCYFGKWEDDLQNGEGVILFSNGDSYEGDFIDGKYWGQGVFNFASGDKYEGGFRDNRKDGFGIYHFADGSFYEGEFKDDEIDGNGRFHFKDGSYYDGRFSGGEVSGKGSLYIPDGEGQIVFSSNKWNGKEFPESGIMLFQNGDEFVGQFQNGQPTSDGVWRRNGNKTLKEEAYRFYKTHEASIKKAVTVTQLALAGVSIAGDVVAVVAAVPCPPAAGVALAVSKVADIANASISGLNIVVGTGVMLRETSDARVLGDYEEEKNIKKEYFKEQAWNLADVAFSIAPNALKTGKAMARLGKTAKSSKAGIKTSSKIVKKYKNVNLRKLDMTFSTMKRKGKIKLSANDLNWIKKDPKVNLRAIVKSKTGSKTFGEGFQEFFVRLSDGDKNQVKALMEIPEIKKTVNHAIRGGGGKHEWLMTKNFTDFLTNPKWGEDGQKAAIALTELVQDTKTVAFKNGGTHFDKLNSGKFHDGLSKAISSSDNIDDLLSNVKKYAEGALTKESYSEFCEIFERCFSKM